MTTEEKDNDLTYFRHHPRAFTLQEVMEFSSEDAAEDALKNELANDARFIPLGEDANQFISRASLIRWFCHLNVRLAKAELAYIAREKLTSLMNSLRPTGVWEMLPKQAVQFAEGLGLVAQAEDERNYVFPIALVLSCMRPRRKRKASHMDTPPCPRTGAGYEAQVSVLLKECPDLILSELKLDPLQHDAPELTLQGCLLRAFEIHNAPRALDSAFTTGLRHAIHNALKTSDSRTSAIIHARAGLVASSAVTLDAIGKRLGLSKERVRQKEKTFWAKVSRLCEKMVPFLLPYLFADIIAQRGSLVFEMQDIETWSTRRFTALAGIPDEPIPATGLLILAVDGKWHRLPRKPKWSATVTPFEFARSRFMSSASFPLIRQDIKLISERLSAFWKCRPSKTERAYLALRAIGKPAHYSTICEMHNTMFPGSASNERSIHSALTLQKHGVVWIGVRGTYALKEWGYERPQKALFDAVTQIVGEIFGYTGRPVPFTSICAEMAKYRRVVNRNSLLIAAHLNSGLERIGRDSFVPRE